MPLVDLLPFGVPLSLGLAIFSIGQAFDSTAIMVENANAEFLQSTMDFEEARMRYINPPVPYSLDTFLWRSKTYIGVVNEIYIKLVRPELQQKLYAYFYVSLWQVFHVNRINWNTMKQKKS